MTTLQRTGLSLAVTLLLFAAKAEKKPAMPFLGETIEVSIVNVDVVVTDRDGNRIHGLKRQDFEIYENRKLQPLSHFAEYRSSSGVAGIDAQSDAPPPQRRTLVLFIEKFKLQNFRVDPFIASIKDLVRKTIRRGDAVSLVFYDRQASVRVRPTDGLAAIEAALDQIATECTGPLFDDTSAVLNDVRSTQEFDRAAAGMAASRGIPAPLPGTQHAPQLWGLRANLEMNRRVSAINATIEGLSGVEGKKILLLATRRLGQYAGAEYYYVAGMEVPPLERPSLDNSSRVRQIIANANAAGVTVYPMFPSGVDERSPDPAVPEIGPAVMMNEMAMLTEIADKTGGVSTWGAVAIAKLLPRVADDVSDYYSLAYRATTRREDETRSVEVRTTDRALKVRARRQFVDRSDDSRMRDRVLAALHEQWKESPLTITATLGQRTGKRKETIPLKVRIPIGQLTMLPSGKHAGAFTVYLVTGSRQGETSDLTQKTQPFEITPADLQRARASHFTYDFDLMVNERSSRVAIGLLDEVSKSYAVLTLPITER